MLFFSNFPDGFGIMQFEQIVGRYGRLKEMFIVEKRIIEGVDMALCAFLVLKFLEALRKNWDRIHIGDRKIFVNLPKYKIDCVSKQNGNTKGRGKQVSQNARMQVTETRHKHVQDQNRKVFVRQRDRSGTRGVWRVKGGQKHIDREDELKGMVCEGEDKNQCLVVKLLGWYSYKPENV